MISIYTASVFATKQLDSREKAVTTCEALKLDSSTPSNTCVCVCGVCVNMPAFMFAILFVCLCMYVCDEYSVLFLCTYMHPHVYVCRGDE